LIWLARFGLTCASVSAGYMASIAFAGGAVAGCGPGSGCGRVLASRWAYWFGLPVSLPALVTYLGLLALTLPFPGAFGLRLRRAAPPAIVMLSILILAAAGWFFLLQHFVIHAWCKFCLATHATAGLASCLLLGRLRPHLAVSLPIANLISGRQARRFCVGGALVGLILLVAGQVAVKKRLYAVTRVSGHSAIASTRLTLHDGQFDLDLNALPTMGSPAAPQFVVSVFDYTCSHCRALHPLLKAAEARYRSRLAIVLLPAPLDSACNPLVRATPIANQHACEYARLGLAVWRLRPEAHPDFEEWVFAGSAPPPVAELRAKVEGLVGKELLENTLASPWMAKQLQNNIALYQANARAVRDTHLPQLMIGSVITHGAIDSLPELLTLLEQNLPLPPR
jgi:uncharacterized membrane protein